MSTLQDILYTTIKKKKFSKENVQDFLDEISKYHTVTQINKNIDFDHLCEILKEVTVSIKSVSSHNMLINNLRGNKFKFNHKTAINIFEEFSIEKDKLRTYNGGKCFSFSTSDISKLSDVYFFIKLKSSGFIGTKTFNYSSDTKEVARKLFFILKSKCNRKISDKNILKSIKFAGNRIKLDVHHSNNFNYLTMFKFDPKTAALIGFASFLSRNNLNVSPVVNHNTQELEIPFDITQLFRVNGDYFSEPVNMINSLEKILLDINNYYNVLNIAISFGEEISSIKDDEFLKFKYLMYSAAFLYDGMVEDREPSIVAQYVFNEDKVKDPDRYTEFIDNISISEVGNIIDQYGEYYIKLIEFGRRNPAVRFNYYSRSQQIKICINMLCKILDNGYDKNLLPGMINEDKEYDVYKILEYKLGMSVKDFPDPYLEEVNFTVIDNDRVRIKLNA